MGHSLEPIKLDLSVLMVPTSIVAVAGIGSVDVADPELIDPVIQGTWKAGRATTAAQYINATTMMHNLSRDIVQRLAPFDALLTPTLTRPAVKLGTLPSQNPWKIDKNGKPVHDIYTWTAFAFPFNATGQPAVSIPMGFNSAGLPLGLQIVGRPERRGWDHRVGGAIRRSASVERQVAGFEMSGDRSGNTRAVRARPSR